MFRNFLTYTNANCFWQFIHTCVTHLVESAARHPCKMLYSLQWCQCCRWKTGKNSVAVVQVVQGLRRVVQTHRGRVVDEQGVDGAGGNICSRMDSSESIHTPRSRTTVTGWTILHRDGSDHCKCVAELNQRSSVLSPFNCSIQHTDQQTVHRTVVAT